MNRLESFTDVIICGLIGAFLIWILTNVVQGISLVFIDPACAWTLIFYLPAGAFATWLLTGCVRLLVRYGRGD